MQWSIENRPTKLSELYGLGNIKTYFYEKAKTKAWPKSMLFRGQFGNGKTSSALIVSQMIVCQHPTTNGDPCGVCPSCKAIVDQRFDRDVIMIDGGQSGKADIVSMVNEFIATPPMFDSRKVVIIEEIQELSSAAQKSLLKTLEHPRDKIHFILLSMENSGASGFNSRCVPFNFKRTPVRDLMLFLKQTMEAEGIWKDEAIPDEFKTRGLATIAQVSSGSIRQALQLLETCITGKYFTAQEIVDNLGVADESMVIDVLFDLCDADPEVWAKLEKFEPFDFFALGYKIVADSAIYKSSGYLPNEGNAFFSNNSKTLAAKPAFDTLVASFNELAPNSKPFLRKSEMLMSLLKVWNAGKKLTVKAPAVNGTGTTRTDAVNNNCTTPTSAVPLRTRS